MADSQKTVKFSFRLEPELLAALQAMKPKRMSMSAYVCEVIDRHVAGENRAASSVIGDEPRALTGPGAKVSRRPRSALQKASGE